MSTEDIHKEMVIAWLSKKDNVASIGTPTWKSLGTVLQKVNGGNKVVKAIEKGWQQNSTAITAYNTQLLLCANLHSSSKMHDFEY